MIPNADYILNLINKVLQNWHENDLKFFEFTSSFSVDNFEYWIEKLIYHDYEGWHYIEEYQNQNKDVVKFVYEGGLEHNKLRNSTIEKIDSYYMPIQNNNSEFHSEGIGNIYDRYINDKLKFLHLCQDNDLRYNLLEDQLSFTEVCLKKLDDDIKNGLKQIMVFKKFKTKGY